MAGVKRKDGRVTRFTPPVPRPNYAIELLERKLKEIANHIPTQKENTEEARTQCDADYYEIFNRMQDLNNAIKKLK